MPVFYFCLNGSNSLEAGEQLADIDAARAHARTIVRDLSRNKLPSEIVGQYVTIRDHEGKELARLDFQQFST